MVFITISIMSKYVKCFTFNSEQQVEDSEGLEEAQVRMRYDSNLTANYVTVSFSNYSNCAY